MHRDRLLALDLGTTGVRALLVRPTGEVLARAYRPLTTRYPEPGRVEQDPVEMWARSVDVMREVLERARTGAEVVAGIGIVTQRATVVAWDRTSGRPLAPAIGWQDRRTHERVEGFRAMGIPLNTLASATKYEWWLKHEGAIQQAAERGVLRLGTPESWLTDRLTAGEAHVTDPGHASCTALFDAAAGRWAEPLLELFGVPAAALPRIVATSEIVGETPKDLLGDTLAVAARAGDQQAAAFAQAVHRAGDAKLTLGTSGMLDLHTGPTPQEPRAGTYALALWRLADGSQAFCLEGTVITAGAAVDWLVSVGIASSAAEVDALADAAESSEGAFFVPALQGLGTPFLDDAARGLLGGLTRGTGRAQVARAILEGIAHRCVDVCEALELGAVPLRVDGGLARSEVLVQAIADLGGRPVERAAEAETTALGAAQLAGLASGVYATPEDCQRHAAAPQEFSVRLSASTRRERREAWKLALERAREAAGSSALPSDV
ncbi:MAG: FGGY family carbohydrate kinase [Myxococcota bacterium]